MGKASGPDWRDRLRCRLEALAVLLDTEHGRRLLAGILVVTLLIGGPIVYLLLQAPEPAPKTARLPEVRIPVLPPPPARTPAGVATSEQPEEGEEPAPPPAAEPHRPAGRARLAIIIDDLGEDSGMARSLATLEFPVTFSVLPRRPHTEDVARIAAKAGRDVLLHLPMEPKDYPKVQPGPGAILMTMSGEQVRQVLAADLAQVPQAVGTNNHMGSRLTESSPHMARVVELLKERGLFFLDSMTTPRSQGTREAARLGLAHYRRDVFLDNVRDVKAILIQLDLAERTALRNGQAVAIGHPHPETLEALRRWSANGVRVRLSRLTELAPER